jgi:uncharacterized integral membrane protein
MKKFKIILIIVIFALAIIVALQNRVEVTTKFLFFSITMPNMLLILLTFAVGFFAGMIVVSLLRKKTAKLKKE